jgi:ABC-2 type transport system ATP-binding protein
LSEATSIDSIIERLGLAPYADRRAGTLSLGNSQRLGLAKALFHNPELLILDEPANGLDPAGIVEVRELLRDLALNRGVTVFISSHLLSEISKIASRIGIIHNGALLVERSAADLSKDRRSRLLVNTRDQVAALSLLGNIVEPRITESGEIEILNSTATQNPDEIARLLVQGGHPPTLLKVEEEDLESYFLRLVGMAKGGTQ